MCLATKVNSDGSLSDAELQVMERKGFTFCAIIIAALVRGCLRLGVLSQ